ncbi:hypothetical protein [Scytonema sp. HK-05]|uniref:hypothetical protein n=1 Tax=Scytonema sp. HK-05 TaxID=1137095 RepID=UPI001160FB65|nr:hypothetical protein [Scytonema sp. HK-05]
MKTVSLLGFQPRLKLRSQCRGEAALREGFPPQVTAERVSRLETSSVLRIDARGLKPFNLG